MPQHVQRPRRDAGALAVLAEPLREPLRVDRPAELVAENEVTVIVGVPGEVALVAELLEAKQLDSGGRGGEWRGSWL
jgi:hypothetical protein